jgi:hypothetical protein
VVTVKLDGEPKVALAELSLVIVGAEVAEVTVKMNDWVTGLPTPLLAVMVIG